MTDKRSKFSRRRRGRFVPNLPPTPIPPSESRRGVPSRDGERTGSRGKRLEMYIRSNQRSPEAGRKGEGGGGLEGGNVWTSPGSVINSNKPAGETIPRGARGPSILLTRWSPYYRNKFPPSSRVPLRSPPLVALCDSNVCRMIMRLMTTARPGM